MKVAGVVVLYNPPKNVIHNISSYASQVEVLFVMDNSKRSQSHLLDHIKATNDIKYLWMGENRGLAYPINQAARLAYENGLDWLLTMDQDSQTPEGFIQSYFRQIKSLSIPLGQIAAVGCGYGNVGLSTRSPIFNITSGSLLNLKAFKELGGYNESFFIDHLDHEYNLKALSHGFEVLSFQSIQLNHQLGTDQTMLIGGQSVSYKSHSSQRVFYFVRNGANLLRSYGLKFPVYAWYYIKYLAKTILKVLFGENQPGLTVSLIVRAFIAGIKGELGK